MRVTIHLIVTAALLFAASDSAARQFSSSQVDREGERNVSPVINPINPGLFSYVSERENILHIALMDGNDNFTSLIELCRYREAVTDDIGRREEIVTNISCSDLNWRPVLDDKKRYWFTFVSRVENTIYAGYVDSALNCSSADNCTYFAVSVVLPGNSAKLRPQWSPDGDMILFEYGSSIYKIANITNPELLATNDYVPSRFIENGAYPKWSPNQAFFAFERAGDILILNYAEYIETRTLRFYSVNQNLPPDRVFEKSRPEWSSAGTHIAYFVPDITQSGSHGINDASAEDDFSWNILIRSLIIDGNDFALRPVNRERFQIRGVSRTRDTLTGPHLINSISGEEQRVLAGYIRNEPTESFPVMLSSVSSDGRQLTTTISQNTHLNNDYLAVMPHNNQLKFIYSSQKDGGLVLNFASWDAADTRFTPPFVYKNISQRTAIMRSALLPGLGQSYKGDSGRALVFYGATALLAGSGLYFGIRAKNAREDYNRQLQNYEFLIESNEAGFDELRRVERLRSNALDDQRLNNRMQAGSLALLAAVYIYNLYDVQQGFPLFRSVTLEPFNSRVSVRPNILSDQQIGLPYPGVQIKVGRL